MDLKSGSESACVMCKGSSFHSFYLSSLSWGQRAASDLPRECVCVCVWLLPAGQKRPWRHLKTYKHKIRIIVIMYRRPSVFIFPSVIAAWPRPRCSKARSNRVSTTLLLFYIFPLFTLDVVFACSHLGLVHTFNTNGQKWAQMH